MRLLLIRHAETIANSNGAISSWSPGEALTPSGLQQAEALAASPVIAGVDAVFTSEMLRARQTAEPLAAALGLEAIVIQGLHEIEAGELDGSSEVEALTRYIGVMQQWGAGDLTAAHPGGHDGHHFLARFDAAIADVVRLTPEGGTAAVITHSGCIGCWVPGRAPAVTPAFAATHPLSNTGVVTLDGSPNAGWNARSWAGVHLDDRLTSPS